MTNAKGFEIPVVSMNPPRFKKDKKSTLSFATGELNQDYQMAILLNNGALGTLIFVPKDAQEQPPKIDTIYEGKKPSQRLYNTMFVYWKQQGAQGSFDFYYTSEMERLIQSYKDKLDN